MKAIVWTRYGPPEVLQLREVEKPVPGGNEVLIKIHATTVTAGDCEMRSLKFPLFLKLPIRLYNGLREPKRMTILGQELAGEIEATGKDVTLFRKGDKVFAAADMGLGSYAEYKCMAEVSKESVLAIMPVNTTYGEAAAVPVGGLEALHFLRKGKIGKGKKLLINGAGGSIGTMGIQLAKYFGAEVTAVDSSGKLEMLRALGADSVIDYTMEDFTRNGRTFDIIFDVVGRSPYSRSIRSLNKNGSYLIANPRLWHLLRRSWTTLATGKKVIAWTSSRRSEDLVFLKELIEAGKIKPVIDRTFSLEQMAEAHRYVETGDKTGNVVIKVEHNQNI